VLGGDVQEAVGVGGDGGEDGLEVGRGGGGRVGACGEGGQEVFEEGQGERGDGEGAGGLPDVDGVVELLGRGEVGEVPRVAVVVDVFRVAADGDGFALRDARVDAVFGAEGVDVGFVVGERLLAAGLEGVGVAAGGGVEVVDRGQDRVGVLAGPRLAAVDFGC
jgi:hypothetical protein